MGWAGDDRFGSGGACELLLQSSDHCVDFYFLFFYEFIWEREKKERKKILNGLHIGY